MGGHIKTVFYLMAVIFTMSVTLTVTTFTEVPLKILQQIQMNNKVVSIDDNRSTVLKAEASTSFLIFRLQTSNQVLFPVPSVYTLYAKLFNRILTFVNRKLTIHKMPC